MSTVRAAESGFPESIDSARARASRSRSISRASRRSSVSAAFPPQYGATAILSCIPAFSTAHERCSAGTPARSCCVLPMYVRCPPCAAAICAEAVWKNASSVSPVRASGTKEIVAPPAPAFLIASSATGLLASASKPSGTSPASARRGLTNRPERTRVGSTSVGGVRVAGPARNEVLQHFLLHARLERQAGAELAHPPGCDRVRAVGRGRRGNEHGHFAGEISVGM